MTFLFIAEHQGQRLWGPLQAPESTERNKSFRTDEEISAQKTLKDPAVRGWVAEDPWGNSQFAIEEGG